MSQSESLGATLVRGLLRMAAGAGTSTKALPPPSPLSSLPQPTALSPDGPALVDRFEGKQAPGYPPPSAMRRGAVAGLERAESSLREARAALGEKPEVRAKLPGRRKRAERARQEWRSEVQTAAARAGDWLGEALDSLAPPPNGPDGLRDRLEAHAPALRDLRVEATSDSILLAACRIARAATDLELAKGRVNAFPEDIQAAALDLLHRGAGPLHVGLKGLPRLDGSPTHWATTGASLGEGLSLARCATDLDACLFEDLDGWPRRRAIEQLEVAEEAVGRLSDVTLSKPNRKVLGLRLKHLSHDLTDLARAWSSRKNERDAFDADAAREAAATLRFEPWRDAMVSSKTGSEAAADPALEASFLRLPGADHERALSALCRAGRYETYRACLPQTRAHLDLQGFRCLLSACMTYREIPRSWVTLIADSLPRLREPDREQALALVRRRGGPGLVTECERALASR